MVLQTDFFLSFQSLVGFKINWNEITLLEVRNLRTFQSLVGFKINWNIKQYW